VTADALLLELEETRQRLQRREEELARERALRAQRESELRAQVEALVEENRDLRTRVDWFARKMFGKSSEKVDPRQLLLAFEAAKDEAIAADRLETAAGEDTEETPRRRPSRRRPSKELPRRVVEVEPDAADRVCACGEEKERIGAETSRKRVVIRTGRCRAPARMSSVGERAVRSRATTP
jgi:hypothetical protein